MPLCPSSAQRFVNRRGSSWKRLLGGDGASAVARRPEHSTRAEAPRLVIPRPNSSDLTEQLFGRLDVIPNEAEKLGGFASVAHPVIVGQRQGYHRPRDD